MRPSQGGSENGALPGWIRDMIPEWMADRIDEFLKAWVSGHATEVAIGLAALTLGSLTFFIQVWHGQASQSVAIYAAYENSESIAAIDRLSLDFDKVLSENQSLIEGEGRQPHEFYMPLLYNKKRQSNDLTFHLVQFQKIMQTVLQCYYDELTAWFPVKFLTGCHQRVTRMLMKEHIIDSFFTIRTYVYCDRFIRNSFKPKLADLQKFMIELLVAESGLGRSHVFLDRSQRDRGVRRRLIRSSDKFRVVRIDEDRCTEYYKDLGRGSDSPRGHRPFFNTGAN